MALTNWERVGRLMLARQGPGAHGIARSISAGPWSSGCAHLPRKLPGSSLDGKGFEIWLARIDIAGLIVCFGAANEACFLWFRE